MTVPDEKTKKLKILDFLSPSAIVIDLAATTKKGVLEELVGVLAKNGKIKNAAVALEILLEREKLGSTGIGQGIALPHAKTDQAGEMVAAFGLSRRGVAFNALDGEPVHLIILLITPPDSAALHLMALMRISQLLKDKFFRQSLREVKSVDEVVRIIKEEDQF